MERIIKLIIGLLLFFIILSLYIPLYADSIYEVDTKNGTKQVVIPSNMSDLDVLLYLAKSYYELYDDYKDLSELSSNLRKEVNFYIESNKNLENQYSSLEDQYKTLIESYQTQIKATPIKGLIGADITFEAKNKVEDISIVAGTVIKEYLGLYASLGVKVPTQSLNFGLGAFLEF